MIIIYILLFIYRYDINDIGIFTISIWYIISIWTRSYLYMYDLDPIDSGGQSHLLEESYMRNVFTIEKF